MITKRDSQVINFLNQYKIARTSTLEFLFYPSYQVAARRLSAITKSEEIKRERDGWSSDYIYYIKKPKQIRHSLMVTDFYREFSKLVEIKKFIIEPNLGSIRPDAIIGFIKEDQSRLVLLEVELSHKGFDAQKYDKWDWQKYFPIKPDIIIITDYKIPQLDYKTHIINTDLKDIII